MRKLLFLCSTLAVCLLLQGVAAPVLAEDDDDGGGFACPAVQVSSPFPNIAVVRNLTDETVTFDLEHQRVDCGSSQCFTSTTQTGLTLEGEETGVFVMPQNVLGICLHFVCCFNGSVTDYTATATVTSGGGCGPVSDTSTFGSCDPPSPPRPL